MSAPICAARASCATTMPPCATTPWGAAMASPARSSPRAASGSASAKQTKHRSANNFDFMVETPDLALQHRRQDAIRRPMAVEEGLDVDDDLLAHVDTALKRGRGQMRQQHDLAGACELDQLWIDGRLMFEHVETSAGDVFGLDQARPRVLVDHLAARGIDDKGFRTDQLEPPRRKQMIRRRRVRAIDGNDIHAREHLIEALPIGSVQFFLDLRRDPAAVVIVDFQTEGVRAARHRLTDPAQSDNAEPLAPNAVTEHPGRAPTGPLAVAGEHLCALGQAPR